MTERNSQTRDLVLILSCVYIPVIQLKVAQGIACCDFGQASLLYSTKVHIHSSAFLAFLSDFAPACPTDG